MKRLFNILVFCCLSLTAFSQEETRVIDSLLRVLEHQESRDKVLTMIELTWEFYDVSYDDCIEWGEKAIKEAQDQGFKDLEADAMYALGMQFAFNGDVDLSKVYLKHAYDGFTALEDTKNAFESLWNIATYEMSFGNIDTAYSVYEKTLPLVQKLNDTSAYAYVLSNMGLIWYKRGNSEVSLRYYDEAKNLFETIGDDLNLLHLQCNIAAIYLERDRYDESRRIFWSILPKFEADGDNYYVFLACKNLGIIYENAIVNYDSALFYFQRAIDCVGSPMSYKENEVSLNNEISGAMVEMANIMERQGNHVEAIAKYEEALAMAESSGYLYGQMEAFVGLGKICGKLGQAQNSLQYFNCYFDLEKKSGLVQLRSTFRKVLAIDYARLGMMEELDAELSEIENAILEARRENAGLYDENKDIQVQLSALLQQHNSQSTQMQTLQAQRNHYRLAFYGLLSIVFFAIVLFLAYKIVRKKRSKV